MNVYDFDGTIYNGDSTRDFYFFCLKRHKSILKFLPMQGYHFIRYALKLITKTQFKEKFYTFFTGIDDIDGEVKLFWEKHENNMLTWWPDWRKDDDVLISASPEFLLEPIAKKMNFYLMASKVDKKTGKTDGENCYGEEKVRRYYEKFSGKNINFFFSDSVSDAPLAKIAKMSYLIKDDKATFWSCYDDEYKVKGRKKTDYNKVCEMTEQDFYSRFLPYSAGSPETVPTYSIPYTDQYKRVNLVYFADSHTDGFKSKLSLDNVKRTIDFVNNAPLKYDAVINAGDIITPFGKTPKKNAYKRADNVFKLAKKCDVPFIFAKGNHDLNDWDNYPDRVLNDSDWGNLFLNFAEKKYGIKRQVKKNGEKSTWHYYDIEDKKIRIVSVDIQERDTNVLTDKGVCKLHGGNAWFITKEQMQWIADVAFNFDDKSQKDWGVILTLHQYVKNSKFHLNPSDVLLDLCVAFNEQGTYSYSCKNEENSFFDMEVNADFSRYAKEEKKPHIVCWLLGHDHERKHDIKKGINIIWTINGCPTTSSSDPRIVRIVGTCTQNSFDVVNIDTLHRKIRIFAYGAKTTCYGESGDRFLPDGLNY